VATFRTRARTVDMLGRQQIAGIPTAISELFKNAYDAYASNAIVDFFRSDRLFVLRDDGIGMNEQDFEQRWLTLGTESKATTQGELAPLEKRPGYERRPVLGEKGIGRLAIAAIGPQVLMTSRSLHRENLGDLLVSFFHWGLFELPSANLADIEIPTVTLPGGTLPNSSDVGTLIDWVTENLDSIARPQDQELAVSIRSDLKNFRGVSPEELQPALGSPSLLDGPGTHFYIRPASDLLADEIDKAGDEQATPLRRVLVGFANTMTPGHPKPVVNTAFRDHYTEDAYQDVISEEEFFTPAEFEAADHHIVGEFDDYGQFTGDVSVYGGEPVEYEVPWIQARGTRTRCGPFSFNLAYVQGVRRDSRLDPDLWQEVSGKLNRYGGLYIYRDGIRVLPYGNSDFDFLDIEVRRAKSASDAFFSYRRMFGVIELTRERNSQLREKAGREGFADNTAYRQFREILKNFLYQVAVDFFRESGTRAERFWNEKGELNRLERARARRARQTRVRRKGLSDGLDEFFARVEDDQPSREINEIIRRLDGRLASADAREDPAEVSSALASAEVDTRSELRAVAESFEVARPRGVGLTKTQTKAWMAYENERVRLDEEIFLPAAELVEQKVSAAFAEAGVGVDRRLRFDEAIRAASERARETVRGSRRELDAAWKQTSEHARELGRERIVAMDALVQDLQARAARLDVAHLSDSQFASTRASFETELATQTRTNLNAIISIRDQFASIVWPEGGESEQVTFDDEVEALETDLDALRDQTERDLELAQLGAAIQVINHEFTGTINAIRRNLRRIKSWADANPALREPYRDLRASFEHLDGYLRLFTPFQRRLYRAPVEISGAELEKFVRDVFERRLESSGTGLVATSEFIEMRVLQYPSVLYPVFVNLVDNALYWLADYRGERTITLDARAGSLVVRDSGSGVSPRDRDSIFEFGFSRKPGGTGYGLYISREILKREGWTLSLAPPRANTGAEFVIQEDSGEADR
jgi:signal transduction histidine kinase